MTIPVSTPRLPTAPPEPKPVTLTKRELQVLGMICEGQSSKEVADLLFVSKRTIDFHLTNIYEKLEVHGRFQAHRKAVRLGLLKVEWDTAEAGRQAQDGGEGREASK